MKMKEEKVITYSNNSLQCSYLNEYHLTAEKSSNIIQFQHVSYLDIRWNPHLPLAKHPLETRKFPDE